MSQSTAGKSFSSSVGSPRRSMPSSTSGDRQPRLISLAKLKDLMHKSPTDERRRNSRDQSLGGDFLPGAGSRPKSPLCSSSVSAGARRLGIGQHLDRLVPTRAFDRYSLLRRSDGQQKDAIHIEEHLVEKTSRRRNSSSDHHQSEPSAAAAALNQFGIRVTQQEPEQPAQNTKRYNTNNSTANKNPEKKVESGADSGGSHQDGRRQSAQLDQAIRGERKLKRPYSSQPREQQQPQSQQQLVGAAGDKPHAGETLDDKGAGPCRIDRRFRINMTPSSEAFCHSLESSERQHSSQLHGSLAGYNIAPDCYTVSQLTKTDNEKASRPIERDSDGSRVLRLERAEQYLEARSRAAVSKAYAAELASSTISRPPPSPSICSSLPTDEAGRVEGFIGNTSVFHDRHKQVNEPNAKRNFPRQSSAGSPEQSAQTPAESATHADSEVGANLRTKTSYLHSESAGDSIPDQADQLHLASYANTNVNRFANEPHPASITDQMVAASHHHSRMIGHNMNTLNSARPPTHMIDRSNIRVSVSTTIENTGSLIAACDISQQEHAPVAPASNECATDHNYNNYLNYNLMTSSKSSSPNSISLTPSPKAQAMQALTTGHHGANQMVPVGLNSSAHPNPTSESHHANLQYIETANSNLQHHQINQQHYAYSHSAPSTTIPSNHHPQLHHVGPLSHEHSNYSHIQQQNHHLHHQHQQQQAQQQQQQQDQQQQQQIQQIQQQQQQHQQQHHQYHHHQQQIQPQQSITNSQFIYHHIANGSTGGQNHGYANVASNVHYHNQLQSSNNQANSLISEAHQSHLNTAAAAAHAAAAVVSQTLKTVASQHNQHQSHHYGHPMTNGFNTGANLMNMAAPHHPQFHGVSSLAQHHSPHHLGHSHPAMNIQPSQQQAHQQQTRTLPIHSTTNSITARKYQCRMCPQVFMSKAEMKYHNQNHLREAKPYKCLQCSKSFANSSYLSQHMRIHQGLKPYACDICSRKFTQLSHLQQHKRTHTGDKPYKCNYMNCTKQFSQLSNLQSHSRCHQLDKPYKCNSCYKCFHDEQSLLEHIPRHLESKHLKRNLCIFCGSSYQQERGLVKHFQQYHTDKSPTLVTAAIAAGTTGNVNLIASLVSSAQGKFTTPSSGSTTSSVSSNSSNSTISNLAQPCGHNGSATGNTNPAHSNLTGAYQASGYH